MEDKYLGNIAREINMENSVCYHKGEWSIFSKYKNFNYVMIWFVVICITNIAIKDDTLKLNLNLR